MVYKTIAKQLGEKVTTVGAIIRKWKKDKVTVNLPRTGAPCKISPLGVSIIYIRGELGESVVVRWGQNPALWHLRVWRRNAAYDPKNTTPTIKHGGGNIMLCGRSSAKGTGQLHRIKGTKDGAMHCQGQGIEN